MQEPPELNEPLEFELKLTDPVGVETVPGAVSLTVAVHVVDWPTTTDPGEHDTDVDVDRALTPTVV